MPPLTGSLSDERNRFSQQFALVVLAIAREMHFRREKSSPHCRGNIVRRINKQKKMQSSQVDIQKTGIPFEAKNINEIIYF
jgi:hypothetical protein